MTAHSLVEVYATVEIRCGAEPFIECRANDIAVFVVGAPAVNREECAAVNLETEFARVRDVERAYTVDEIVCGGHIAPRTELVDFDADRMDDVVDAVLHDDRAGACDIHFDREARSAFETVSGVGDATVFAKNACAAHCATDDGNVVETFACTTQCEVIGPILCRDGIAKTDKCEVLFFGENVNCVEKINPVRFAREVIGESRAFGKVAVAVFSARKWARDSCTGVHLCEICKVKAHIECFACGHVEWNFVTQNFFARGDGGRSLPAESNCAWRICWNVCGCS